MRHGASAKWRLDDSAADWRFGATSVRSRYDADLDECVAAARNALNRLDLVVTGGDLRDTEARIDARSDLSELVRILMKTPHRGASWVSFAAGREWAQDGATLVESLKEAFEACLEESRRSRA